MVPLTEDLRHQLGFVIATAMAEAEEVAIRRKTVNILRVLALEKQSDIGPKILYYKTRIAYLGSYAE